METENAKRKCDEENDSTQCNGEDDSKFSHQFLESQESKTAEEAYVLSLRSIQKDFLKGLGATAKFHDFFKKLIIVFQSKHPEQSIPEDVQKKWVAITRNIVLGPVPSRRARVDKTPRTAADLQYTTRATQIYYLIKQPIDRFNSSIPGYKKSSKRKKVISGTSAENAEHGNEEEEEPMQEEQEKSPQPLPLCVIEQPIISGDEFPRIVGTGGVLARVAAEMSFNHLRGGFGKTSFSDDEGGPETEEEIQIRGVGVYEESDSSTEEQHRPHDIGDETAELNSTDIQSQHDSDEASSSDEHSLKPSVGARPQREKKEIDRFGTHTKHNEIKPRHGRRRKTAIVSSKKKLRGNEGEEAPMSLREELEEVGVVDSVQMVHLKNVGVVVVPFERPSEQLPALEEAVMVPFGVHKTTLAKNYNADKSSRCLRPPLSTMFSTSSSPQIQGFPKGAYCRVIRNTNKINLNVDIFLQSIHTFDTFSVIASQMCEDEPADIPKYVACATSYLEPTYARRYQLSRGDMLFADARMLLRVTEDTVLYFKSPHQYEECTVALCDGTTPLDEDLLFNYPGDCEDTDFFLHDNTLVEMALLQYLFRTSNLVDDHMRWGLTSKYVNVVRKAMTETVVRYSTLQRFQHLDNVTNFVEAEILRKLCVDSLAELNPKFESLSVWSMRMLVLACLYAKSTFFAEVWWFGNMDWALKDAVRSLCLASKQSASLDVNSVRMEDLLSYSKTAANDSIQEFIRAVGNASSCAGNDYVALDQMDFTSLGRQLKTDLKSYQTANQLKCTCREKCTRECVNWKSSILCTQANCCLMTRSPQTTCGNALQDLPTPELVVRNCDDAFIGKELAAGDLGFEVGQFVCQYLGVVVTSTEQMDWEGNHYTILCNMQSSPVTWPRYVYVNAKDKGTVARHANHSDNPNCVMVVWNMAETPLPILFARRDILPGEAITFHYRGKSIDFFGLGGCLCKSVLCKNHVSRKGLTELEMLVQTSYEKQFARSTCCSLSTIPDLKQKKMRASPPPSQSVQPLSPPENEKGLHSLHMSFVILFQSFYFAAHKVMSIAPRGTTVLPGLITPAEEPNLSRQRDQGTITVTQPCFIEWLFFYSCLVDCRITMLLWVRQGCNKQARACVHCLRQGCVYSLLLFFSS